MVVPLWVNYNILKDPHYDQARLNIHINEYGDYRVDLSNKVKLPLVLHIL